MQDRWENLWAAEEPCLTELLTRDAVIDKVVYAASNPVKDLLVERAEHWPGVNGYVLLMAKRRLRARRPVHFFRAEGVMPEEVELDLVIPPELGPAEEIRAAVRAGVESVEREMVEERRRTGKRILGRRAVRQQSWRSSPTSRKPRRTLRGPRCSAAPTTPAMQLSRRGSARRYQGTQVGSSVALRVEPTTLATLTCEAVDVAVTTRSIRGR
jgi:hypothetical protein